MKDFQKFIQNLQKITDDPNSPPMLFVPFDYFKMYCVLLEESMKELYQVLHEINMYKEFSSELKFGEMTYKISGPKEDTEKLIKASQECFETMAKTLTKIGKAEMYKKEKRKRDDGNKSYQ